MQISRNLSKGTSNAQPDISPDKQKGSDLFTTKYLRVNTRPFENQNFARDFRAKNTVKHFQSQVKKLGWISSQTIGTHRHREQT